MASEQYESLIRTILEAPLRPDRTGVGSRCVTGERIVVTGQFPIVTTKRVLWRNAICELLWMISGSTNTQDLVGPKGKPLALWDVNQRQYATRHPEAPPGALGPIYGKQWTAWTGVGGSAFNQLDDLIDAIRRDPFSRRHMVTAFNPAEMDSALPPCIPFFQVVARPNEDYDDAAANPILDMIVTQRSADCLLGLPFNLVQYAALQHMIASLVGMRPGKYTHNLGDAHIYVNHEATAREMIEKAPETRPDLAFIYLDIKKRERKYLRDFVIDHFEVMTLGPPTSDATAIERRYHELDLPTYTGDVN